MSLPPSNKLFHGAKVPYDFSRVVAHDLATSLVFL